MALEKTKENKLVAPENIKKTKRNRRKTECIINRRNGCGICGSLNVALQGVSYCNICGLEEEFLVLGAWHFSNRLGTPSCSCVKGHKNFKGKIVYYRDIKYIDVGKCLDCGSVQSSFCPNNKNHRCWKSSLNNKKFCQNCGYRI